MQYYIVLISVLAFDKAIKDLEAMKTQSKNLSEEYDRMAGEHANLEKKLRIAEGGSEGDKKDD